MNEQVKEMLLNNMVDNLPTLRKKLNMSQDDLAKIIGVGRSTISNIESKRNSMTWNMFLSLLLIFTKNEETNKLLNVMEIYTDELNDLIKQRQ